MIATSDNKFDPFIVDVRKGLRRQEPQAIISPWKVIKVNREYGGDWFNIADVDGDGEVEIFSVKGKSPRVGSPGGSFVTSLCVQKLDGSILWTWGDPKAGKCQGVDKTARVHDIDNDGNMEVIVGTHGKMFILDGKTGKELHSFALPMDLYNDRMVFADIQGKGWRSDIVIKEAYTQLYAYTAEGKLIWHWVGGTGHTSTAVDIDNDGREEIMAGGADGEPPYPKTDAIVAINYEGKVVWKADPYQNSITNPFLSSLVEKYLVKQQHGDINIEAYIERPYARGKYKLMDGSIHFYTQTGHPDHVEVIRVCSDPADTRIAATLCQGNGVICADGYGNILWKRMLSYHCEMVRAGKLRNDVEGVQLCVDYDHIIRSNPRKPLAVFHEDGDLIGHYITNYARNHQPIDWNNDGKEKIIIGCDHLMLDGYGNIIAEFEIPEGLEPWIVGRGDCTGTGVQDAIYSVYTKSEDRESRQQWIYIFTNTNLPLAKRVKPEGTGVNFTFY